MPARSRSHRPITILFLVLVLSVGLPSLAAQAAGCSAVSCVYLPLTTAPTPYVLPNHSIWVSIGGFLHISGEVQNPSDQNLNYVEAVVDFYDGGGQFVGTDYSYAEMDVLPAHERTCFDIIISNPPATWASYTFEPTTYSGTSSSYPALTVLNNSASRPYPDEYEIIGQIRNDSSAQVQYVEPIATLYDASGHVLNCGSTFVNSTHLNPGQISAFDLSFFSRDYRGVASYRLQVDGNLQ